MPHLSVYWFAGQVLQSLHVPEFVPEQPERYWPALQTSHQPHVPGELPLQPVLYLRLFGVKYPEYGTVTLECAPSQPDPGVSHESEPHQHC